MISLEKKKIQLHRSGLFEFKSKERIDPLMMKPRWAFQNYRFIRMKIKWKQWRRRRRRSMMRTLLRNLMKRFWCSIEMPNWCLRFEKNDGHAQLNMPIIMTMHHPNTGIISVKTNECIRKWIYGYRISIDRLNSIDISRWKISVEIIGWTLANDPKMMSMKMKRMRGKINVIQENFNYIVRFNWN